MELAGLGPGDVLGDPCSAGDDGGQAREAVAELVDRAGKGQAQESGRAEALARHDRHTRLVEEPRGHGWDDEAIQDAIQVIAYFNYINRVAEAVGIGPEPEWEGAG